MQEKTYANAEDNGEMHDSGCEAESMQSSNHEQSKVSLLAESDKDPEKQENGFNDLQLTVRRDENRE